MEFVEVFESPGKGRGLRATREVWAGDVLFAEPPFASVVFESHAASICHSCFRRQQKLQRCGQCRFVQYCDKTCQSTSRTEIHRLHVCSIHAQMMCKSDVVCVSLAARILWRLDKQGRAVSDTQLTALEELEDHIYDISGDDLKDFKVDIHNFLDYWPRSSKPHTVDSVSHILGVINCNGFMVSDQRGLQAVGVVLFPNLCLVNHDCWPNCTVILNSGQDGEKPQSSHPLEERESRQSFFILNDINIFAQHGCIKLIKSDSKDIMLKKIAIYTEKNDTQFFKVSGCNQFILATFK
uniref:[histone H3]-lysine(4) N-trimethyltransferase n=1 Tax=Sinocyclocheilus rhinocerous TaxID=307959 RepID=A0A673IPK0_9TELE